MGRGKPVCLRRSAIRSDQGQVREHGRRAPGLAGGPRSRAPGALLHVLVSCVGGPVALVGLRVGSGGAEVTNLGGEIPLERGVVPVCTRGVVLCGAGVATRSLSIASQGARVAIRSGTAAYLSRLVTEARQRVPSVGIQVAPTGNAVSQASRVVESVGGRASTLPTGTRAVRRRGGVRHAGEPDEPTGRPATGARSVPPNSCEAHPSVASRLTPRHKRIIAASKTKYRTCHRTTPDTLPSERIRQDGATGAGG